MAEDKRAFHARLEQVEPTLFRATYRADTNPEQGAAPTELEGPQILPDMHIGTDPASVKSWVEQLAASLGYERVIWDELPG
jgi:hypothetical protein